MRSCAIALPSAALIVLAVAGACATSSVIEIPPCADRVETGGQAERLSARRFRLDHTFDLPLSRTVVSFRAGKSVRSFDVVNTQPDALRFFVGAGVDVLGAVLIADALLQAQDGRPATTFYESPELLSGVGSLLLIGGTAAMFTGWHPPQELITFPDVCPEEDPYTR
jgi:hypothetical protein